MRKRTDEERYPCIEEFDGWYNLGYKRDDGVPVLQSRKRMPGFMHGNFLLIYRAERRWFDKLVPRSKRKPFDPLEDPPFYLYCEADDRTLTVCADGDYVTAERLRRMQQEVLGRYPLWRVFLILEDRLNSIMIYPDAIRYGKFPLDVAPQVALRKLVRRGAKLREKRLRPKRAEVSFLQQRLPDAVRAIRKRRFLVLGVLDNVLGRRKGEVGRLSVFFLVRGANDSAIDVEGPPGTGNDFLWHDGSAYRVNAKGAIVSSLCTDFSAVKASKSAPFCVGNWLPPANFRGPLTVIERVTGKRHTFEVKSEEIVRADLQE